MLATFITMIGGGESCRLPGGAPAPRVMGVRDREVVHSLLEMCRSIKRLRERDVRASDDEIEEAALQFVRKISGYRQPSKANEAAFLRAVSEIAGSSQRLMITLTSDL